MDVDMDMAESHVVKRRAKSTLGWICTYILLLTRPTSMP